MNRREFIRATSGVVLASAFAPGILVGAQAELEEPSAAKLPRWRGFNLLEKFTKRNGGNPAFRESDFQMMQEWGFNFARLPMSYLCWTDPQDWLKLLEPELKHIDEAVQYGERYGVHINLNFHRAPGYCVNPPKEPRDLWTDPVALEAAAHHWAQFAKRYRGIPNRKLSFDLLNEPPDIAADVYHKAVKAMVEAIRSEDPNRLIIADGLKWGRDPVYSLAELKIGQSTRGYDPMQISHHQASWVNGSDKWPEPSWPLKQGDKVVDRETLRAERIKPWQELEKRGVGVHVGEWGSHNRTPHAVALAWMSDLLELWREAGWGWALWNLRGSFGILDSDRKDVAYEVFRGHKLDRKMLNLLLKG